MAKQTFTTGSVLTATQMNDLQTNDFNWTVSQKTASYVLVAADKGTRIEMNAAGATTVTVNTGLFTAGDTLFIQNIGAGACTVTAGTATVNKATAGSLTLAQYQGGTLYFVSASSAVFFADAGYTPPLTTKGDLFGYDTAAARIPIGSNNQVLTADSTQALGLKWAAVPAASKSFSLLNSGGTALTGAATVTVSGISGIDQLLIYIQNASSANASSRISVQFNSDTTGGNYVFGGAFDTGTISQLGYESADGLTSIWVGRMSNNAGSQVSGWVNVFGCNTSGLKIVNSVGAGNAAAGTGQEMYGFGGFYSGTSTISSVSVVSSTGNLDGGRVYIYGAA